MVASRSDSGFQQSNDFHPPWLLGDFQEREGHRQLKAAWPRAARVQVEHTCIVVLIGLMGMATDNRVKTSSLRLEVEILKIVEHVEMEAGGLDNGSKRELLRPRLGVHIAAHGKHGCDEFELRENFRSAHVSRMNEKLHTAQGLLCFRPEQSVGIGNDADPHGGQGNG